MSVKTIIHGNFYQPMREAPWSNVIINQESAAPYANWTQRVCAECYAPNAFSRIIGNNGKILNILNNFEYISFDVGPALLNWLSKNRPDVYVRIIEADKKSVITHNGHGNAIAQVYSHLIMSLATFEDKKTQIIWAMKDFEHRFGRKTEGIWLAECSIDYQTIDLLIEQGIKFIILSPTQAKAFKKSNETTWYQYDEQNKCDTSIAYKITRAGGSIAVFYYDKQLSGAVSFEHLLHNSDDYAHRIIDSANQPKQEINLVETNETQQEESFLQVESNNDPLVTIVTDGEIYGHYEPFGDMCLSSMISRYYLEEKQIDLINFAQYLDMYPPTYETMIDLGEDAKGSSWSCVHGVARWYRDCGCKTDGDNSWQQHWRTPLRQAFDLVKTEADEIFVNQLKNIYDNPFELRNNYIDFILRDYDKSNLDFITKTAKKILTESEIQNILQLLHIQACSMYMYSSNGWFYSDISEEDTISDIKYAHTVLMLLEEYGSKIRIPFEQKLAEAKSNILKYDDGKNILFTLVYPKCLDYHHLINNFIAVYRINKCIELNKFKIFSSFNYKNLEVNPIADKKDLFFGSIEIIHKRICNPRKFVFIFKALTGFGYKIYICSEKYADKLHSFENAIFQEQDVEFDGLSVLSANALDDEIKSYILKQTYANNVTSLVNQNIGTYGEVRKIFMGYKLANLSLPQYLQSQLLVTANAFFEDMTDKLNTFPTEDQYKLLIEMFSMLDYCKLTASVDKLKEKIRCILLEKLNLQNDILSPIYSDAIVLLQFCNQVGLKLDRACIENIVFDILKKDSVKIMQILSEITDENQRNIYMLQYKKLIIMADVCNIQASAERKMMMNYLTDAQVDNPHRF